MITKFQGDAGDLLDEPAGWRPDGREIAFITAGDPKLIFTRFTISPWFRPPAARPRILTKSLDRNVIDPQWSADGRSIYFLLEDDLNQVLARMTVASGKVERVLDGQRESLDYDLGAKGASLCSTATSIRPTRCLRWKASSCGNCHIRTMNGWRA